MVSTVVFGKMDNCIWIKIKKYLKYLHPNKGWNGLGGNIFPDSKLEDKYLDKWILTVPVSDCQLVKMRWTNIDKRHLLIKNNYSPYGCSKADYFKNR